MIDTVGQAALVYLLTQGIKELAKLLNLNVQGTLTAAIALVVSAAVVAGYNAAVGAGLVNPQVAALIGVLLAWIGSAGAHAMVKRIGK